MTDEMAARIPVMTRAEVKSRVAGLLTVCAGIAEGSIGDDEAIKQMRALAEDVLRLYFFTDGSNAGYEELTRPVIDRAADIYSARLAVVIDAFTQAFTELARAYGRVTGDPEAVTELLQQLALFWAAQAPEQPPAQVD